MEQLQQLNASVNALNGRSWGNNAFSSLSVMEAMALCTMHFLRQRSQLSNRMCMRPCMCVCVSRQIQNNGVKSARHISCGHMVKPALLKPIGMERRKWGSSFRLLVSEIAHLLLLAPTESCDYRWVLEGRAMGKCGDSNVSTIDQDKNCLVAPVAMVPWMPDPGICNTPFRPTQWNGSNPHLWLIWVEQRTSSKTDSRSSSQRSVRRTRPTSGNQDEDFSECSSYVLVWLG